MPRNVRENQVRLMSIIYPSSFTPNYALVWGVNVLRGLGEEQIGKEKEREEEG